jgi:hypothetical protein
MIYLPTYLPTRRFAVILHNSCILYVTQVHLVFFSSRRALNSRYFSLLILAALDSSGRLESGFLLGNNHWLGSEKGCQSVKAPLYVTLSNRFERLMKPDLIRSTAPFEMDYRIVFAKHYSPWQIEIKFHTENLLHIGLCMPKSCTNDEIHNLTQEYLNSRTLDAQNLFEFESDVLLVKDMRLRENFFSKTSVILLG